MQPRAKIWVLAALVAVASGQAGNTGCPVATTSTPQPSPVPVAPQGSILVAIENKSGLTSVVDAVFLAGGVEVRRTTRVLTADGIESTAKVIRTTADQVQISARIASPVSGTIQTKYLGGFVLATSTYQKGVDFEDQGGIDFVIPPPPSDCNGNGVPDAQDIASTASRDCDGNTVPDECENGIPTVQQCAGNLVVPADDHGTAVVPDMTRLLTAVDTCTPSNQLIITQDVPAGSALQLGHLQTVNLTVKDGDGNTTGCASSVTMVDVTPPVLTGPAVVFVTPFRQLKGKVPDMRTLVQLSDNCQAVTPPTFTQSIPVGTLIPLGPTLIHLTAVDGSGNTTELDITLKVQVTIPDTPES